MKIWMAAGIIGLSLTAAEGGQQTAPLPGAPTPQQAIPDAPKPQLPAMDGVAPGRGTTSTSNGTPLPDDPFQKEVGATLPSSPAASDVHEDDGPAPDLPSTPIGAEGLPTLRIGVNYVEVPFTVKDSKGRLVPGLTWRDVRVYENGLRQHMVRWVVDPVPLSVAIVIDQSLPFDVMTRVNNSLGALQGAFAPYDEVAVITYNNGPKMQTDFTGGQSARLTAVIERSKSTGRETMYYAPSEALEQGININSGQQANLNPLTAHVPGSPGGISSTQQVPREVHTLNDAILAAAQATTHAGKGRRRVVYVISDGKEYGSTAKTKEVIRYLQTNQVEVYATLVGDASVEGMGFIDHIHLPLMMRDNILPVYTAATGGQFYAEYRSKGIEQSFQRITEQERTQYMLGYNTRESFLDGKYRTIEVKVLRPNLNVIAKKGYYPTPASAPPPAVRKADAGSATP